MRQSEADEGGNEQQRPEEPEAVVEAGEEPVRPDAAVAEVAEDAVGFAAAEGLLGRRQIDRAEVVDPGQRVAGVDEVAQVPVAATGQRREGSSRERSPPSARGAMATEPDDQDRGRQQEVELRPGGQARREADDHERHQRRHPPPPYPASFPLRHPHPRRSPSAPRQPAGRRSRRCRSAPPRPDPPAPARSARRLPAPATTAPPGTAARCTSTPPGTPRTTRCSAAARARPGRRPASRPRGRFPRSPGRTRPGTAAR